MSQVWHAPFLSLFTKDCWGPRPVQNVETGETRGCSGSEKPKRRGPESASAWDLGRMGSGPALLSFERVLHGGFRGSGHWLCSRWWLGGRCADVEHTTWSIPPGAHHRGGLGGAWGSVLSCHFLSKFEMISKYIILGLPWWLSGKESTCSAGDMGSVPGLQNI